MSHDTALREFTSDLSYRLLVESVSDYAIYMLHPDGTVANWNAGAERAKGYVASDIVGRHFSVFYTAEERAAGRPAHGLATAHAEGRFEARGWRLRKDGSRFWAHVVIEPVHRADGSLLGFAKITRDCTEQKRMEDAIRQSERRFRLLVEGITDYAIYMLDTDGTIANWNAGAERAKGYTAEEIVGQHYSVFYSAEERAAGEPARNLNTALTAGKFEAEGWRLRKDGSRFWAHVVIDPIYQEDGELLGFAKITRDRTEHNRSAEKIAYMARHDVLAGLPNRARFIEKLDAALVAASGNTRVAVVNIDLDRFKEINDTYGHATGDKLLQVLSARMSEAISDGEMIGRFGGDEFVATKSFESDTALRGFVARLQKALTAAVSIDHTDFVPGASLGVSVYPADATDRDKLLNNADLAMYRAKESLDEKICFYEAEMDEAARARRAMARDIWTALENNQFFLHYQTQRTIETDAITGYEALLRWNHPVHGMVSPAVFIPIAEECGAICALGDWVLETACREATEWQLTQKVAVNLSPLQLAHVGFVDTVRATLLKTGLPAHRLELEVTESAVIADKVRALHILRQLRAMGIGIALDDFGTGYSSLETLRAFPFDRIKLDRSFISELETNRQAKAFVRAILALGNSLDVTVLAEGVETSDQMAILAEEGCNEVQGFLFGRPTTLEDLHAAAEQPTAARAVA
ncbi:putative bifunctional diguanylate cyclase/phosphodiesterase [Bradyrhizobium sp. 2TAF24]|uniref:putative bifunctional diguanylate cyclase/phosphodiesterase n=1 Tax=Bradyrhizobium sp. 2TAF24 TaxID=3233011 RepID=UPI003F911414